MVEHTGTHLDAPAHLYKGGKRMAQIPIDRLVGPAVVVDVEESVKENPDYQVTVDDLKKWESKNGPIPDKAIVLMNSGWSKKYPNKTAVFGSENHNDSSTFHYPSLGLQAMEWLVTNRDINLVGVDTPSLDYGANPGPSYPVHVFLLKNDIPGLENVANVQALPQKGATVTVGALKIKDGSGAPVRLIGVYDDNPNSGSRMYFSLTVLMFALILHL